MLDRCCTGTCFLSATRALVRLGTDVGRLGLSRSQRSNSSQRCLMVSRSGLCAGQSSSSTPISTNHFCMDLALCTRALSCWNWKGPSKTVAMKLEAQNSLECHCILKHYDKKTAPDLYSSSTKLYSWHYALGQVVFSCHPPNPDSFLGLPDGKAWFVTPENAFPQTIITILWACVAYHFAAEPLLLLDVSTSQ